MQTLEFSRWELAELTCVYHELRNERQQAHKRGDVSTIMLNRTERLFDKLRFSEFAERTGDYSYVEKLPHPSRMD